MITMNFPGRNWGDFGLATSDFSCHPSTLASIKGQTVCPGSTSAGRAAIIELQHNINRALTALNQKDGFGRSRISEDGVVGPSTLTAALDILGSTQGQGSDQSLVTRVNAGQDGAPILAAEADQWSPVFAALAGSTEVARDTRKSSKVIPDPGEESPDEPVPAPSNVGLIVGVLLGVAALGGITAAAVAYRRRQAKKKPHRRYAYVV